MRTQIPHGRRVLDQKSEIVNLELRQDACHIGTDGVFHSRVEAIIDVRKHEIEFGTRLAHFFDFADPLLLYASGEARAETQK